MPLNATLLGQQLKTASDAFQNQSPPADAADMEARLANYWEALASAIIAHIQSNGVVSTTVTTVVATPSGAGTGTGTGTGTIA